MFIFCSRLALTLTSGVDRRRSGTHLFQLFHCVTILSMMEIAITKAVPIGADRYPLRGTNSRRLQSLTANLVGSRFSAYPHSRGRRWCEIVTAAARLQRQGAQEIDSHRFVLPHHGVAVCRPRREARTPCGTSSKSAERNREFTPIPGATSQSPLPALAATEDGVCPLTSAAIEKPPFLQRKMAKQLHAPKLISSTEICPVENSRRFLF